MINKIQTTLASIILATTFACSSSSSTPDAGTNPFLEEPVSDAQVMQDTEPQDENQTFQSNLQVCSQSEHTYDGTQLYLKDSFANRLGYILGFRYEEPQDNINSEIYYKFPEIEHERNFPSADKIKAVAINENGKIIYAEESRNSFYFETGSSRESITEEFDNIKELITKKNNTYFISAAPYTVVGKIENDEITTITIENAYLRDIFVQDEKIIVAANKKDDEQGIIYFFNENLELENTTEIDISIDSIDIIESNICIIGVPNGNHTTFLTKTDISGIMIWQKEETTESTFGTTIVYQNNCLIFDDNNEEGTNLIEIKSPTRESNIIPLNNYFSNINSVTRSNEDIFAVIINQEDIEEERKITINKISNDCR